MTKTLSVAFVWHMHQPLYKDHLTGKYLMPWVRLHAIKDYLDMVMILKDFPKIRQTFNLVPSLIDQLFDYAYNDAHDLHSLLMIKPASEFTAEDKIFILERFFDANYSRKIAPNNYYHDLYQRAKSKPASANINSFSDQEYADIIAWFNLVWFDPLWYEEIEELRYLFNKERNYTLKDLTRLLEIQRDIIKKTIPIYKEYQDRGQIEVIVTPYYHPIMPLLVDTEAAHVARPNMELPETQFCHPEDAQEQLRRAIEKYEDIFGHTPKGIWPSEQSVSPEVIKMLADAGVKWAISDEGVLASTLGKEFHRNFYGNLESPKDLCQPYNICVDNKFITMVFRNIIYSDLIGFQFGKMEPSQAAWEMYDRIKDIQEKLINSTDDHIVTIALDGENCWEFYEKDGIPFLRQLYTLLSDDQSLNITTVGEYIEKNPPTRTLNTIHSGSWINRDFHIWIGDPAKNTGWKYLKSTRDDLVRLTKENKYDPKTLEKAWEELYIAEGSDWFWWYGDPNFSGQDDLFDEQFRLHLQNVYRVLAEAIPAQLFVPVEVYLGRSLKYPSVEFTPSLNGKKEDLDEWRQAGVYEIKSGAMYQSDVCLRRIWYGFDKENLNIRIDPAKPICTPDKEIYIYAYNPGRARANSNVRIRTAGHEIPETFKYRYAYELNIDPKDSHVSTHLSEAVDGGLWQLQKKTGTRIATGSVIEMTIPFDELKVSKGEEVHFVVGIAKNGVLLDMEPMDKPIIVRRS